MSIHAADALMGIFGFKRVADDEITLDNQPPLDDDGGSLNEGMEMSEVKNEGLEVVAFEVSFPLGIGRKVYEQEQAWANHNYGSGIVYHVEPLCRHSEALAGYAVRDARISTLEFELEVAKTDELSAAVWAATETIKHELWDAQTELAAAKETIMRYETTAENCDVLRAELAAIYAAPVAKQDNAAKMPCGAAVSNVYEAYEAGLVAKQVVMPDDDELMQMAFEIGEPCDDATGYWFSMEDWEKFTIELRSRLGTAEQEGGL